MNEPDHQLGSPFSSKSLRSAAMALQCPIKSDKAAGAISSKIDDEPRVDETASENKNKVHWILLV